MRTLLLAQSARLADFLPSIAYVLLLARSLGPAEYGHYAFGFNVAFVCSSLLPPSLPDLLGRHLAPGEFARRSVAVLAVRVRLPFTALGLCVVAVVVGLAGLGGPMIIVAAVAAFLALEFGGFTQGAAAGLLAYGALTRWRAIGRASTLALAIALAWVGALDSTSALLVLGVGQLVSAAGTLRAIWAPLTKRHSDRELAVADVRRFGIETWLAAVLTLGLGTQKDVLMLGFLGAGASTLGIYSAAATLSTQLALLLTGGWVPASLPVLSQLRHDQAAFGREWVRLVRGWALIVAPSFTALAVASTQLVPALFGAPYGSAAAPLVVFAVGYASTALVGGAVNQLALYARDQASAVLLARLAAFVINVSLAIILIPAFGATGAALATAIAVLFVFGAEYARLWATSRLALPIRHILTIGGATVVSGFLAVTIGTATHVWLLAGAIAMVSFLLIAVVVGEIRPSSLSALWRLAQP